MEQMTARNERKLNSKKVRGKLLKKAKSDELMDKSPSTKISPHKENILGNKKMPKKTNMKGARKENLKKHPLHFVQEPHLQKGDKDRLQHMEKKKRKEIPNTGDSFLSSEINVTSLKKNVLGSRFGKKKKKLQESESSDMLSADQPHSDTEVVTSTKKKRKNRSESSSALSSKQAVIQETTEAMCKLDRKFSGIPHGNGIKRSDKVKDMSEISARTDEKLKSKTKKRKWLQSENGDGDVKELCTEPNAQDVQFRVDYGNHGNKRKKRVKNCESSFDGVMQNASSDVTLSTNTKVLSTPMQISTVPSAMDKKTHLHSESPKNDSPGFIKLPQKKLRGFEGREDTPERLNRTVFVGNLPLSFNKKLLHALFQNFGEIESVRLRSVVPAKASVPKKVALIRKEFHSKSNSLNGYVVFKNLDDVEKALTLNKTVVQGHHIRVDRFKASVVYDDKRSVFVGNLAYDASTDSLWSAFGECGGIEAVRVVRDPATGLGKGFGFVLFEECDSVGKALLLNETEVNGRSIRVKPVEKGNKHKSGTPAKGQRTNLKEKKHLPNSRRRYAGQKKTNKKLMKRKMNTQKKKSIASILT